MTTKRTIRCYKCSYCIRNDEGDLICTDQTADYTVDSIAEEQKGFYRLVEDITDDECYLEMLW